MDVLRKATGIWRPDKYNLAGPITTKFTDTTCRQRADSCLQPPSVPTTINNVIRSLIPKLEYIFLTRNTLPKPS